VDPLEAFGDDGAHAQERGTLDGPITRAAGSVLVAREGACGPDRWDRDAPRPVRRALFVYVSAAAAPVGREQAAKGSIRPGRTQRSTSTDSKTRVCSK
jgi:hypothetical protein